MCLGWVARPVVQTTLLVLLSCRTSILFHEWAHERALDCWAICLGWVSHPAGQTVLLVLLSRRMSIRFHGLVHGRHRVWWACPNSLEWVDRDAEADSRSRMCCSPILVCGAEV